MNIGIIFGGKSFEHDISIITANIIYHALCERFKVYLLYIDKDGSFKTMKKIDFDGFEEKTGFKNFSFINHGIKIGCRKIRLDVIIGSMHGINGEDGISSMICNLYDIPYVGSNHISSGILMDKHFTYAILRSNGIKLLKTKYLFDKENVSFNLNYPLIIKPARLGSSIGINIVKGEDELENKLCDSFNYDTKVVIQPFVKEFREVNQALYSYMNEICVSKVEEVFKHDEILSFEDKYIESKIKKNKEFLSDELLIEKISSISKKVYSLFELSGIVRIDYMIIDDEVYLNEINTTPGSLSYYLFDLEPYVLFERNIYEALRNYNNKKKTIFYSSVLSQKYINKSKMMI